MITSLLFRYDGEIKRVDLKDTKDLSQINVKDAGNQEEFKTCIRGYSEGLPRPCGYTTAFGYVEDGKEIWCDKRPELYFGGDDLSKLSIRV